jgi:predicted RNA-binding Zn-ribbon protein involved in translation (DUF1610 family)
VKCTLCGAEMKIDEKGIYYCEECGTEISGKNRREITVTCEKCGVIFQISQKKIVSLKKRNKLILCEKCSE